MVGPLTRRALAWAWLAASLWAAPPEWAVSGRSPRHPPALYVLGTGSSTESVDLARQAAMADVVRQIRSRIRSTTEDERWESSSSADGRGRGESSFTGAKVRASEEVEGIQIAETARDGKTWYALAILERSAFAAPGRTAMREAESDARARWDAAVDAVGKKRPREALDALRRIAADRSLFLEARDRAALGEPDALGESFALPEARTDSLRREIARGFRFRRLRDSVVAGADQSWPDSTGLAVEFTGAPVSGLEVDLLDPSGRIAGTAITDSNGCAAPRPSQPSSTLSPGWARWAFRPRLELHPSPELGLSVRWMASLARVRLEWLDSTDAATRTVVENRLSEAGWLFDPGAENTLAARLRFSPKGDVQGFSGSLHRIEARLSLSRNTARVEAVGVGTGGTTELAARNALERITIPPGGLRELVEAR